MAARDFFVTPLLESIRDRCMLPASDDTLNDARLLRFVNDELQGFMSDLLLTLREEHNIQPFDVGPIATGGNRFRIPPRALGSVLREVRVLRGADEIPTVRLELDSRPDEVNFTAHMPYWLEGDDIVFTRSPLGQGDVIRFRCFYMPQLAYPGDHLPIATIASDRKSFTFDRTGLPTAGATPDTWPATPQPIDFIRLEGSNYPRGLGTAVATIAPSGLTGTVTLAGTATVPNDITVGHYATQAGKTVAAALPEFLQPTLAQRVAYVALRAIGDPKAEAALAQLVEMKANAIRLMQPRTEAQPRFIINRYSPGWRR